MLTSDGYNGDDDDEEIEMVDEESTTNSKGMGIRDAKAKPKVNNRLHHSSHVRAIDVFDERDATEMAASQ